MATVFMAAATPAYAQAHRHDSGDERSWSVGAMAALVGTEVQPAVRGRSLRELYLSQPLLVGGAAFAGGRLDLRAAMNFEGAVMRRGELTPGIYGEGYIDRRHPHTTLHELMLVARQPVGRAGLSLGVGKGFVPFGSDDPMMRPFQKYPVNHHIAQILERAMVAGAARLGPLSVEGSLFNGDEPERPGDLPNLDRLGDSWSGRGTLAVGQIVEVSASLARVHSPEDAGGKGLDQRKVHTAVRFERAHAGLNYALVEYGNTGEYRGAHRAWDFSSTLVEAGGTAGVARIALRYERTTRPDEERSAGDFRSFRPLLDFSILGRSRWDVFTLNVGAARTVAGSLTIVPFAEGSLSHVRPTILPTTFVPSEFYGSSRLWTISVGARIHAGTMPARMGRVLTNRTFTEH